MDRERERKAGKALGIGGSIYGIVFVVVWCVLAAGMGAWFMLIFGIPMLGFLIFRLVVLLQKSKEKPADPWDRPVEPTGCTSQQRKTVGFCPYCGEESKETFEFCPKCGRRLP